MNNLDHVSRIAFYCVVLCLFVFSVSYITYRIWQTCKVCKKKRIIYEAESIASQRRKEEQIKNALILLQSDTSSEEAAKAFGILLKNEHILIHILHNNGNNYNNEIQSAIYQQSLTPQSMNALFKLEEHHGGYWL